MSSDFTIRRAHLGDIDALIPLYHYHLSTRTPNDPIDDRVRAHWELILNDTRLQYFVAEVDGIVAGTCHVDIVPNLTHGMRPYAIIENVVTHSDYRRRGIGRMLIDAAVAAAWEAGCYKVQLMSGSVRREAHLFYESVGFDGSSKRAFEMRRPG